MPRGRKAVAAQVPERSPVTEPVVKKRRTPVGQRNVLTVSGKDPDYVYRVVNDESDRISQFLDGGYEICNADEVRVGDRRVGNATPEGSQAQVSVGGGRKAIVMKIRKEFYQEDQAAKHKRVDDIERALRNPDGADYGKLVIDKTGSKHG